MRTSLFALVLAASAAGAAQAQSPSPTDAAMAGYFNATLNIDVLSGWSAKRYFQPDHTYWQTGDDGPVTGTWSVENGKVCTTADKRLVERAKTYCNEGVGRVVGDQWTDADPVTTTPIMMSLSPGRPAKS